MAKLRKDGRSMLTGLHPNCRGNNVIPQDKNARLKELFLQGATYRQAASEVGCANGTAQCRWVQWREGMAVAGRETAHTNGEFLALKASDILARPSRYINGLLLDMHRHWTAEDKAAVAVLCAHEVSLDRIEPILARPASAIAWKAAQMEVSMPRAWRLRIFIPRRTNGPRPELQYPYIIGEAKDDHAFLLAVNAIVPRGLPGDLRADVCQDMLLAILEGNLSPDDLETAMPNYLKAARKRYQMPWGTVSLDAPLWDDGRPLYEILAVSE